MYVCIHTYIYRHIRTYTYIVVRMLAVHSTNRTSDNVCCFAAASWEVVDMQLRVSGCFAARDA